MIDGLCDLLNNIRGGSRSAAISKIKLFVKIVNGFQTLTIITKRSILDVAEAQDPPLNIPSSKAASLSRLVAINLAELET